jgi:hypothetical protein
MNWLVLGEFIGTWNEELEKGCDISISHFVETPIVFQFKS